MEGRTTRLPRLPLLSQILSRPLLSWYIGFGECHGYLLSLPKPFVIRYLMLRERDPVQRAQDVRKIRLDVAGKDRRGTFRA